MGPNNISMECHVQQITTQFVKDTKVCESKPVCKNASKKNPSRTQNICLIGVGVPRNGFNCFKVLCQHDLILVDCSLMFSELGCKK